MLTQNCNENLSLGRRAFQNWQLDRAEQYLSHAYMLAQVENMIHLEIAAGVLLCDLYATLSEQYSAAHDTDRARAATLETLKHAHYMQTPSEEIEVLLSATARYRQLATGGCCAASLSVACKTACSRDTRRTIIDSPRKLGRI